MENLCRNSIIFKKIKFGFFNVVGEIMNQVIVHSLPSGLKWWADTMFAGLRLQNKHKMKSKS
jgi:hypothetical protein